jgi:hypothetical protein
MYKIDIRLKNNYSTLVKNLLKGCCQYVFRKNSNFRKKSISLQL